MHARTIGAHTVSTTSRSRILRAVVVEDVREVEAEVGVAGAQFQGDVE